jgi:uncharacterized protein (TIGR02118 family)
MIKLMAIYYQPEEGETFDEEYYKQKHLPFVKENLPGVVGTYYARGMPTPTGDKPPIVGIGIVDWKDVETFTQAMASPNLQKIRDDHPNYSTCRSEVVTFIVEEV